MPIERAARIIRAGGVVAYPTEGVFGFGCLPDDAAAVLRILDIKQRDVTQGLVLIAADAAQLDGLVAAAAAAELRPGARSPVTWIVPATDRVPAWIRGDHAGVA
ncbi:MAG TPA: Sua5/YciO/YrdC/YwlC family protein, partial [Woeseiaceae bacterium]|nr:Sua5/YciO/YrdC/YwlC family protein [Woeseiaceae bacterium]